MNNSTRIEFSEVAARAALEPFVPQQKIGAKAPARAQGEYLLALFRVLANQQTFASCTDVLTQMLQLAAAQFDYDCGLILRKMSPEVYEVVASSELECYFSGQHIPLLNFECLRQHDDNRVVMYAESAKSATNCASMAYTPKGTCAYLGMNLDMGDQQRGVVCFVSSNPQQSMVDETSMLLLELTAEGIACMMDLQKARTQRKTEDMAIFASGSMKSLEEYQMMAELPEGLGISGKVVDVLKRRIGQSSLSIDHIAEELNLSKRTLQRRLQQQGISFAELRDRVRFHYSIDFLVRQQVSIDRISSTLDFSDRTSFTNAFKRWTGLSPSTFRKVFRDYV